MSIFATIQVRMGSTRLPGKVLTEVEGKPLLGHLLDRVLLAKSLDGVVVATSVRPENDAIENYCRSRGTPCFRGAEDDVLGRMLGALDLVQAETGVVIFGDCPLIDPAIIDEMVGLYQADGGLDFLGNDLKTTYPPGMEVEVFKAAALKDADDRCPDPAIREHGTLFIRRNPQLYRIRNIEAPPHFHRPELELEVDTPEDMTVMQSVLDHFAGNPAYGLGELIAYMEANPDVAARNRDVPRRWKEFRQE
jgi:spore coat polysaccharide biosynthesis protein SpsF (cytidylyltransferase family)